MGAQELTTSAGIGWLVAMETGGICSIYLAPTFMAHLRPWSSRVLRPLTPRLLCPRDLAPRDISGTSDPFARVFWGSQSLESAVRGSRVAGVGLPTGGATHSLTSKPFPVPDHQEDPLPTLGRGAGTPGDAGGPGPAARGALGLGHGGQERFPGHGERLCLRHALWLPSASGDQGARHAEPAQEGLRRMGPAGGSGNTRTAAWWEFGGGSGRRSGFPKARKSGRTRNEFPSFHSQVLASFSICKMGVPAAAPLGCE